MKKYLLVACVLLMCMVASLFSYSRPGQGKKTCLEGCKKDHEACLSQSPATDPEKEAERKNACHERYKDCVDKCG